jgi:hypothetical protein
MKRIKHHETPNSILLTSLNPHRATLLVVRNGGDVVGLDDDVTGGVEVGEVGGGGLVDENDVACARENGQNAERGSHGRKDKPLVKLSSAGNTRKNQLRRQKMNGSGGRGGEKRGKARKVRSYSCLRV